MRKGETRKYITPRTSTQQFFYRVLPCEDLFLLYFLLSFNSLSHLSLFLFSSPPLVLPLKDLFLSLFLSVFQFPFSSTLFLLLLLLFLFTYIHIFPSPAYHSLYTSIIFFQFPFTLPLFLSSSFSLSPPPFLFFLHTFPSPFSRLSIFLLIKVKG